MMMDRIRAVANAILYEGYMLYPYRPSALKNRSQGWTFGTLLPAQYAAGHPGEPDAFEAQVLVVGEQAQISAEIRFLQLCGPDAIERSIVIGPLVAAELLLRRAATTFAWPGSDDKMMCLPVQGVVQLAAERVEQNAMRFTIALRNQSLAAIAWDHRDSALRQSLVSAHAVLTLERGEFVSLLNPSNELSAAAAACKHTGVFPVLAGEERDRTAMLISPVILYDYPQVAPASHGDFFDSSEIDEMLTLRVLTLTDEEKEEIRAHNTRARELLRRTESLTAGDIGQLHGALSQAPRSGGR